MSDIPELPPVRGLVAGKYELIALIGRGGMGSVWEGRHASLGSAVAIKFIDLEHAKSREAQSRFVHEARAAARIQSRHAVQILDHGVTEDGRAYMVMELLVGEALDKRIDRLGRLSLESTARILGQVCRALQRAHDCGIVHRDLKPDNVFLVRSPDEDEEVAKVLDFGVAKITPTPGDARLTSGTKTGAVLGTPYYMSPEQARGLRTIDWHTDLWSLGVIAYECVTGELPFDGESVGDLLVKICTSPVPVPSEKVRELPAAFDAWFACALDREPVRRFDSATELAESLSRAAGIVHRSPMSSSAGTSLTEAVEPIQPSAAGVTAGALTASASPRRTSRSIAALVAGVAIVAGGAGAVAFVKAHRPGPSAAVSASEPVGNAEPAGFSNSMPNKAPAIKPAASNASEPSAAAPSALASSATPTRTQSMDKPTEAPGAGRTLPAANPRPTGRPEPALPQVMRPRPATPRLANSTSDPGY